MTAPLRPGDLVRFVDPSTGEDRVLPVSRTKREEPWLAYGRQEHVEVVDERAERCDAYPIDDVTLLDPPPREAPTDPADVPLSWSEQEHPVLPCSESLGCVRPEGHGDLFGCRGADGYPVEAGR